MSEQDPNQHQRSTPVPMQVHYYTDQEGWTELDPNKPLHEQSVGGTWFSVQSKPDESSDMHAMHIETTMTHSPSDQGKQRGMMITSGIPSCNQNDQNSRPNSPVQAMVYQTDKPLDNIPIPPGISLCPNGPNNPITNIKSLIPSISSIHDQLNQLKSSTQAGLSTTNPIHTTTTIHTQFLHHSPSPPPPTSSSPSPQQQHLQINQKFTNFQGPQNNNNNNNNSTHCECVCSTLNKTDSFLPMLESTPFLNETSLFCLNKIQSSLNLQSNICTDRNIRDYELPKNERGDSWDKNEQNHDFHNNCCYYNCETQQRPIYTYYNSNNYEWPQFYDDNVDFTQNNYLNEKIKNSLTTKNITHSSTYKSGNNNKNQSGKNTSQLNYPVENSNKLNELPVEHCRCVCPMQRMKQNCDCHNYLNYFHNFNTFRLGNHYVCTNDFSNLQCSCHLNAEKLNKDQLKLNDIKTEKLSPNHSSNYDLLQKSIKDPKINTHDVGSQTEMNKDDDHQAVLLNTQLINYILKKCQCCNNLTQPSNIQKSQTSNQILKQCKSIGLPTNKVINKQLLKNFNSEPQILNINDVDSNKIKLTEKNYLTLNGTDINELNVRDSQDSILTAFIKIASTKLDTELEESKHRMNA